MQCKGVFVFRGLDYRGKGSFKNEKGEEVNFSETYILKLDEQQKDGKVRELNFRISPNNRELINDFKQIALYEKIEITFDVLIYNRAILLVPIYVELM